MLVLAPHHQGQLAANVSVLRRPTGEPALCQECSERLWAAFLAPVIFYPLAAGDAGLAATGGPPEPEGPGVRRISANNWTRTWLPPGEMTVC